MDKPNTISIERDGPVKIVTIERPHARNAIDNATAAALADAFRDFAADDEAKVGILCGAEGAFCAGADLKAIASGERRARYVAEGDGPMGPTRMAIDKPIIAAIAGHAVAGGLELALWCDLRIMEEDAIVGVYCRRWGVPLIDGGTVRLPRLIGMSRALDLILTGRPVTAAEALTMGLANRVVPKGQALEAARALAHELSRFPQTCLRADRRSAYGQSDLPFEEAMRAEFANGIGVIAAEGMAGAARFAAGKGRSGSFSEI